MFGECKIIHGCLYSSFTSADYLDPALFFSPMIPVSQKITVSKKQTNEWKREKTNFSGNYDADFFPSLTLEGNDAVILSVFFENVVHYFLVSKYGINFHGTKF
jgi:hypothetical protein